MVQMKVDDVRVRRRVRKDMGDLKSLMDSMRKHGLLQPIVVTDSNELIAGHRRLESARRLGWQTITARIVDEDDPILLLEMEIEENEARKNFSSDEMADALMRLDRLRRPSLWMRFLAWLRRLFGRTRRKQRPRNRHTAD